MTKPLHHPISHTTRRQHEFLANMDDRVQYRVRRLVTTDVREAVTWPVWARVSDPLETILKGHGRLI